MIKHFIKNILQRKEITDELSSYPSGEQIIKLLQKCDGDHILSYEEVAMQLGNLLANSMYFSKRLNKMLHPEFEIKTTYPTAKDIVESVIDLFLGKDITLIMEPGWSLIADAAVMLTSVIGCKETNHKRFIVVDGAMNDIIRPSLYLVYHHIELAEPSAAPDSESHLFDIVGPICESGDFFGKDRWLSKPHEGCLLALFDVGAYCMSMASNYNLRMRPAEILVNGSTWKMIRKPDTFESFLKPYLCNEL